VTDDDDDRRAILALRSLGPLLDELAEVLDDASGPDRDAAAAIAARIYTAGHRDGVRYAVGEIAPEAGRRGIHLYLSPGVAADAG
jgi:hypothetical protein